MYTFDTSTFWAYLQTMLQVVSGVFKLDPQVFIDYLAWDSRQNMTFWIVLIGGISLMIGQSVVLFANRVPTVRFFLSLILGALGFLLNLLVTVSLFWLYARLIGRYDWAYLNTLAIVGICYAPYWLSFLILIPYLGLILEQFFKVYTALLFVLAGMTIAGLTFWQAIWLAAVLYLVNRLVEVVFSRPLTPLLSRFVSKVMGVDDPLTTREIYENFSRLNR